jgi:hypothetical protein
MGVDASDFRKLAADHHRPSTNHRERAQIVVRKSLVDGVAAAKNRVPVDTGNLKGSIGHSDLRTVGSTGTIGGSSAPPPTTASTSSRARPGWRRSPTWGRPPT